jgi:hypothetical protein
MENPDINYKPPAAEAVPYSRRNILIMGVSIAVAIGLRGQEGLYASAENGDGHLKS